MNASIRSGGAVLSLLAVVVLAGCNQTRKEAPKTTSVAAKAEKEEPRHDGWWCQEHGVPEHLCSLCSDKVKAKCKKEGDWCKEHDRALSQCFKCDPGKYKQFEAMYVAKYGKTPERPPEEEFTK